MVEAGMDLRDDLRLALDRVAFAEACGLPSLDDWQKEVLSDTSKRVILNCCRQSGKSTLAAVMALHKALFFPRSFVQIYAPSLDQSTEAFRKIAEMRAVLGGSGGVDADPESLRKTGLELANGSRIEARPGTEKTSRGRTADLLVIDEASRCEDSLYFAIRPQLLTTGGELVLLSTPYGRRGFFFEEWTSEAGGSRWYRTEVTVNEIMHRVDLAQLEEDRRTMPPDLFEQEYYCRFLSTGRGLVDPETVERAVTDDVPVAFGAKLRGGVA